jgi:hypothetical protein
MYNDIFIKLHSFDLRHSLSGSFLDPALLQGRKASQGLRSPIFHGKRTKEWGTSYYKFDCIPLPVTHINPEQGGVTH